MVAFGNAGAVVVLLGRMAGMVLVPEGKTRFFFFSVQRPQSVFLPGWLLFALLHCFCHLASLLLLPSGGSKRKVGGALLF